ncbi:DUF535 family protein [uncultured Massilia sp.]|uniref:DUF535 family protein n=1 Tax=uncultured Massilia sp. TaxID=169973 RepID=UPI0025EC5889|nr:DUF535 family protein [uncultured Massilia sp.]
MVIVHLARHWLARRHYPFASWSACIARSLRVLLFYRDHARLLALGVYRDHLTKVHDDVFHHLSHRDYLAKGLTLRERVRCVTTHYRFEEQAFDAAYRRAVYRDGGLVLWRREAGGMPFEIRLDMASRLSAEGDLTIVLLAGGRCLHRLSFSWVDGRFAGVDAPLLPFVARNQGHRAQAADLADAFRAFERAFPNNSPSFFCFAALQGIALALGMDQVVAVKSARQCAHDPAAVNHFANAYDGFWQVLGGVATDGRGWRVALPFHVKPLADMPSKHRKRAALRRAHWRAIGDEAGLALRRHLVQDHAPLPTAPAACAAPT